MCAMIEKLRIRDSSTEAPTLPARHGPIGRAPWWRWGSSAHPGSIVSLLDGSVDAVESTEIATRNKRQCPVANIKSQKKRNITNAKAHERNKSVRSELKSRIKAA